VKTEEREKEREGYSLIKFRKIIKSGVLINVRKTHKKNRVFILLFGKRIP
jgi:hypothetical protein